MSLQLRGNVRAGPVSLKCMVYCVLWPGNRQPTPPQYERTSVVLTTRSFVHEYTVVAKSWLALQFGFLDYEAPAKVAFI